MPDQVLYADDEAGKRYLEAVSKVARASHNLDVIAAAKKVRHGAEPMPTVATARKEMESAGDPEFKTFDALQEKIDGDQGTLSIADLPGAVVQAKRVNGVWKLNLAEVANGAERGEKDSEYKEPDATLESLRLKAELFDRLAKGIESGRISDEAALAKAREDGRQSNVLQLESLKLHKQE